MEYAIEILLTELYAIKKTENHRNKMIVYTEYHDNFDTKEADYQKNSIIKAIKLLELEQH